MPGRVVANSRRHYSLGRDVQAEAAVVVPVGGHRVVKLLQKVVARFRRPIGVTAVPMGSLRLLGAVAVCSLLAAALSACGGASEDSDEGELVLELEEADSKVETTLPAADKWSKDKDDRLSLSETAILERTVRLAEDAGGEVHYVDSAARGNRSVLVLPREFVGGATPLVVSLHGYGGNSADHAAYIPLHERVNTHGFALLMPNGTLDSEGNRFWNPTDRCCDGGKSGEDDVAYLADLVAQAGTVKDFGPVFFFGYSNGGFMSYHMACKGLSGLRAVASLAGTSYVEDSLCSGAPPVSVLHIHGTADSVIRYEGDANELSENGGEPAFHAGAQDMVMRWSQRAGCDWPEPFEPYANLDLDRSVSGSETQAFRLDSGCAEGIDIELWKGVGSSHAPNYGDAFVDALVGWLLSQE